MLDLLFWFLPRRTFPDRRDPTVQGYAFLWKPIATLLVAGAWSCPLGGTSMGGCAGGSPSAWSAGCCKVGVVDVIR
jgi:hypothetical protein